MCKIILGVVQESAVEHTAVDHYLMLGAMTGGFGGDSTISDVGKAVDHAGLY